MNKNEKTQKIYIALIILIGFPIFLNIAFVITDILAGKKINNGEFLYSSLSNKEWLSFWGSFLPGFLSFALIFHYEKVMENNNFNHQKELELYERHKKEEILLKEFEYEFKIVKDVMKSWDSSILFEYSNQAALLLESDSTLKNARDVINIFAKIKTKLDREMLEINLLSLRLEDVSSELKDVKVELYQNIFDYYQLFDSTNQLLFEKLKSSIDNNNPNLFIIDQHMEVDKINKLNILMNKIIDLLVHWNKINRSYILHHSDKYD